MSGTKSKASVTDKYIGDIRSYLRVSSTSTDDEIRDLIQAARSDLILGGIKPSKTRSETDALIKRAIGAYAKAEYGLDNPDSEKYRASYENLKTRMSLSGEYKA